MLNGRVSLVKFALINVLHIVFSFNTSIDFFYSCFFDTRQAVCEWGRDSVESWGRRRRSVSGAPAVGQNDTSENGNEDMTQISQEILVLDFGDEKQSQFLKSNEPQYTDFNKGIIFRISQPTWWYVISLLLILR